MTDSEYESARRMYWRTGRKVGRTIYAQMGPQPSDFDPLIGVMDTRLLAEDAVAQHNQSLKYAINDIITP